MNFIGTNRKGETKLYFLPIVQNNIVHQENNKILDKILVSLFYYFCKSVPSKDKFRKEVLRLIHMID